MKIIILVLFIAIYSCGNNNSAQIKIYEDSARMFVDSFVKYRAPYEILDDSVEIVRKNKFLLYHTMYEYYHNQAEELKK